MENICEVIQPACREQRDKDSERSPNDKQSNPGASAHLAGYGCKSTTVKLKYDPVSLA
ncbi:hypothetical protein [Sphingomonas antarctica]|uniref:hypothetical protein n=1 Tax=Sphingomonas antarctica TaxID=2040274 RepID=UPI0039E74369